MNDNIDDICSYFDKYVEDNKLEIPSLEGEDFFELANRVVNDQEKFGVLLALLAIIVRGKHLVIVNELAENSIKYKKEKKAYVLNIILDILCYIEFIKYLKVSETIILVEILNDEIASSLHKIKRVMIDKKEDAYKAIRELDDMLKDNKEYQDLKKQFNINEDYYDNTTTS